MIVIGRLLCATQILLSQVGTGPLRSSTGAELRHVEVVHAGGVAAGGSWPARRPAPRPGCPPGSCVAAGEVGLMSYLDGGVRAQGAVTGANRLPSPGRRRRSLRAGPASLTWTRLLPAFAR